jgi:asparagine synthase (glutamine-hydrolysing)
MCGIVGFVDKKLRLTPEEKQQVLEKMLARIKHRGPDGQGTELFPWGGIAHARLSILDLSDAAAQPMWNAQKTLALSFNGEIYNHNEFKRELEQKYTFHTHADTESLLHAYEEWGSDSLTRMRGMFAFNVYDARSRELFFAVDRFGIKPLYYIDTPEWFAWSSEAKAFKELPGFIFEVNESRVSEYLMFRSVAGEETLLKHVHKLLPGQTLTLALDTGNISKSIYWHHHATTGANVGDLLKDSVREHMLSDVPVGVQLSGGLDSSLVSALVRRIIPESQELHSFSIGLRDGEWNEFPYSRRVSEALHTVHHELYFDEQSFCRQLPLATYHYDEPINHSHSVPMMMLSAEAKKHATVLLSGEGADELFGGYRRYATFVGRTPMSEEVVHSNAFSSEKDVRALFQGDVDLTDRRATVRNAQAYGIDPLSVYDTQTYLTTLLLRQDKMGMRSGLENRVPFLDHRLVEAAYAIPFAEKMTAEGGKLQLKEFARTLLPEDIVSRPKVGFGQPIDSWLRNCDGLGAYLRALNNEKKMDFLDKRAISRLVGGHQNGKDNSRILWTLLNFWLWHKIFIQNEEPESLWGFVATS